jgi:hypothetical protein
MIIRIQQIATILRCRLSPVVFIGVIQQNTAGVCVITVTIPADDVAIPMLKAPG